MSGISCRGHGGFASLRQIENVSNRFLQRLQSLVLRKPLALTKRRLSTARIWSTTATESGPALGMATTTGGKAFGEIA